MKPGHDTSDPYQFWQLMMLEPVPKQETLPSTVTLGRHKGWEEGFTVVHFLYSPEQPEDRLIRLLI